VRKSEKGFAVVEILIIVFVIGLLGTIGWFVYDRQNDSSQTRKTQDSSKTVEEDTDVENPSAATETKYMTVTKGSYALRLTTDVRLLPAGTPESFKTFIKTKLSDTADQDGCWAQYTIQAVSPVNVLGIFESVNGADETDPDVKCVGGARLVWALTPKGTWDETGGHDHSDCTSKNGGKVYEEFAAECYTDSMGTTVAKNPNGSVTAVPIQ
jgi:Tfp pilus assembly protein PilE